MSIITLVLPWFGRETAGGAEDQARQLSIAMHAAGARVEVWATNGRDAFAPPTPYYPEGPDVLDGVPIRRFAITPPCREPSMPPAVQRRAASLPALPPFPEHELRLLASLVSSDALLEAVATAEPERRFLFMVYPFPTTFWGLLLAGERGALLPCLHNEPYARYGTVRWMFERAPRILANSEGERELMLRLYTLPPARVVTAGEGIDLTLYGDGARFRERHGVQGPLLLYSGRRDAGKNVPLLLSFMREYRARRGGTVLLGLTGRDPLDLPPAMHRFVRDFGDLSVAERQDAYAAADIYIHPSLIESFSRVVMEAWLQQTPVLVHADCDVTRQAVEASGGGLTFADFGQFAAALDLLLARPDLRRTFGERGRAYVLRTCRWEDVARRTIASIENQEPQN